MTNGLNVDSADDDDDDDNDETLDFGELIDDALWPLWPNSVGNLHRQRTFKSDPEPPLEPLDSLISHPFEASLDSGKLVLDTSIIASSPSLFLARPP